MTPLSRGTPHTAPLGASWATVGAILARGYLRLLVARQKALDEVGQVEALYVSPVRTDAAPATSAPPTANLATRREPRRPRGPRHATTETQ